VAPIARRPARSGPAADAQRTATSRLDAAEFMLAATGRSNPVIAQELFVSIKTVEAHLSETYRKLGLAGQGARACLVDALGR
jgi:DNA-binding NarL/FixJ family response regulator